MRAGQEDTRLLARLFIWSRNRTWRLGLVSLAATRAEAWTVASFTDVNTWYENQWHTESSAIELAEPAWPRRVGKFGHLTVQRYAVQLVGAEWLCKEFLFLWKGSDLSNIQLDARLRCKQQQCTRLWTRDVVRDVIW